MADSHELFELDALADLVAQNPGSPEFPALAEATRRSGDAELARQIASEGLAAAPGRLAGRVALGLALIDLGQSEDARDALSPILDAVLEPHRASISPVEAEAESQAEPDPIDLDEADRIDDSVVAEPVPASPAPLMSSLAAATAMPIEEITDPRLASVPATGDPGPAQVGDDEIDDAFAAAEPQVDEMISPNRMAERVLLDHAPIDDEAGFEAPREERPEPPTGDGVAAASPLFRTATMAELLDRQGDVDGAEAIRRELSDVDAPAPLPPAVDAAVAPEWPAPELPRAEQADEAEYVGAAEVWAPPSEQQGAEAARLSRILSTLETWLQNIQRGRA